MKKIDQAPESFSPTEKLPNQEFQVDLLPQGEGHLKSPQSEKSNHHYKAGDRCPQCQSAKLDYDGLLNLGCPACGYVLAGCFT